MNTLKITGLFAIALVIFGSSCKDEIDNLTVTKQSSTAEFTIEKGNPVGAYSEVTVLNYDLDQIASDNGVNPDKFKSLKIKSAAVESTNGQNFDALESVSIAFEADGLAKKVIVVKNPVNSNGATAVNLDVDPSLDLLPYFRATNLKVYTEGTTNASLTEDLNAKVNLTYDIVIDLIN